MGSFRGNGILQQKISDKDVLNSVYMSFVKGGGLFIPTSPQFILGEEIFISLSVMDARFGVSCKVVWISPSMQTESTMMFGKASDQSNLKQNYMRAPGAGVQFIGGEREEAQRFIENQLTGMMNSNRATQTM